MMKKRFPVLVLALVMLLGLSGCLRFRTTITVRRDGKFDFEMLYAMSIMGMDYSTNPFDDQMLSQYEEEGFKTKPYSDGDYSGIIISKEGIEGVSQELPGMDTGFTIQQDGSTYTVDIPWTASEEGGYASQLLSVAEYIQQFEGFAEIVVTFPEKPIEHNATSVSADGKTLTWNLLELGDRTSLHAKYSVKNSILPGPADPGAAERSWIKPVFISAGVVLCGVLVFLVIRKAVKNKKAAESRDELDEA